MERKLLWVSAWVEWMEKLLVLMKDDDSWLGRLMVLR